MSGDSMKVGWLRFYSAAVLVGLFIVWLWDRWLWGLRWVQKLPGVPRDIRGTWEGVLESLWINPATNEQEPPKPAYIVVRQTASHVSVCLLTDESRSTSSLAVLTQGVGGASLDYMYLAQPGSRFEHRSRMHHGSASLAVVGHPVERLRGRYWTNRDSRGELTFHRKVPAAAEDFEGAKALFRGTGKSDAA